MALFTGLLEIRQEEDLDGSGNATARFNPGTAKDCTILRAETAP